MFERLDRVALVVEDLAAAQSLFEDLLDLDFDPVIEHEDLQIRVAFAGRFGLELASPMSDRTPIAAQEIEELRVRGDGIRYVVVKVRDLDAAVARFAVRGIEPVGTITLGNAREAFFDPADLHGLPLVLNEYREVHGMTAIGLARQEGNDAP